MVGTKYAAFIYITGFTDFTSAGSRQLKSAEESDIAHEVTIHHGSILYRSMPVSVLSSCYSTPLTVFGPIGNSLT